LRILERRNPDRAHFLWRHDCVQQAQLHHGLPGAGFFVGARVHLTNTAVIPDQFDLTVARKERSFRARMVWRSVEAGVV